MAVQSRLLSLTPEQIQAVHHFKTHGFTVITGGPGSGKTTVIKHMIAALGNNNGRILLCAPTANSTTRIERTSGHAAFVLSRVLYETALIDEYQGCNLIIDEASMVSVDMLRQAIKALKPKRVGLAGDVKQLPCSEGFSVLATLLAVSCIPVIQLTQNHRQTNLDSGLVRTINELGDGKVPVTDDSFQIISCKTKEEVLNKAAALYGQGNAQMLGYTNETCALLNEKTANSRKPTILPGIHVGDRIVCTSNVSSTNKKGPKTLLVANGMLGVVKTSRLIVYDNGFRDTRRPSRGFRTEFVPARCMTVHKSQGNEFDETGIIVLGGWKNPPLELMYTALSRFKSKVYVIGLEKDIKDAFQSQFRPVIDPQVVNLFGCAK